MNSTQKRKDFTKINYLLDLGAFIAFLIAMDPRSSGIAIHEWLSIAFGGVIVVHLVLHWDWIVAITRRFLRKVAAGARFKYLLNALLFVDGVVIILSGLLISEVALPTLGLRLRPGIAWRWLHSLSADVAVFLLGLHVALSWKWIVSVTRRYIIQPLSPRRWARRGQEVEA